MVISHLTASCEPTERRRFQARLRYRPAYKIRSTTRRCRRKRRSMAPRPSTCSRHRRRGRAKSCLVQGPIDHHPSRVLGIPTKLRLRLEPSWLWSSLTSLLLASRQNGADSKPDCGTDRHTKSDPQRDVVVEKDCVGEFEGRHNDRPLNTMRLRLEPSWLWSSLTSLLLASRQNGADSKPDCGTDRHTKSDPQRDVVVEKDCTREGTTTGPQKRSLRLRQGADRCH